MNKIVEIYDDNPMIGTWAVAQGFERPHKQIVRLIKKHEERFLNLGNNRVHLKRLITRRVPIKTAGRPVDEIMLNDKQAIFLGTLFRNSDRVLDFKEKLAEEFVDMRIALMSVSKQRQSNEWIANRAMGKVSRKEETDTIKDFVKYATMQGSKSAEKYYMIFSKLVNTNLLEIDGKFKNIRDMLDYSQLMDIKFAEGIVSREILKGMSRGDFYKDIYVNVKAKIEILSGIHGKTNVLSDELLLFK